MGRIIYYKDVNHTRHVSPGLESRQNQSAYILSCKKSLFSYFKLVRIKVSPTVSKIPSASSPALYLFAAYFLFHRGTVGVRMQHHTCPNSISLKIALPTSCSNTLQGCTDRQVCFQPLLFFNIAYWLLAFHDL